MSSYDLPDKFSVLLGRIAVRYVAVEHMMMFCIQGCTDLSPLEIDALLGGEGLKFLRLKLWRIVNTNYKDNPEVLSEWGEIDPILDRVEKQRNHYIHNRLSTSDNPETLRMIEFTRFIREKKKEKKKFALRTITTVDESKLKDLIGELDTVLKKLEDFSITCILTREIGKEKGETSNSTRPTSFP